MPPTLTGDSVYADGKTVSMIGCAREGSAADKASPCRDIDPCSLAAANINPLTGLSSDYLNHFNEAVMLLELIPLMPECRADLVAWHPLDYREHFARSQLRQRELAIAAYDQSKLSTRRDFDALCARMTAIVLAAQRAIRVEGRTRMTLSVAAEAAARLRPLLAAASALIHGHSHGGPGPVADSQAAVDAILAP